MKDDGPAKKDEGKRDKIARTSAHSSLSDVLRGYDYASPS